MIRIKIGRNAWLTALFVLCVLCAIFSEQKIFADTALYGIASKLDMRNVKYILECLAIAVGIFVWYLNNQKIKISDIKMHREAAYAFFAVSSLAVITVIFQLRNGFMARSYKEIVLFFLPLIFAFVFVNVAEDGIEFCFDAAFYLFVFLFIYYEGRNFTIANFRSISFINSLSPFESGFSFMGCILLQFFLFRNKKVKSLICLLITVISFKRVAMIYSILLFLGYRFIPKEKKVNPVLLRTVIILFIIIPTVFITLCNDEFADWFYRTFSMDINKFMMGRFDRLNMVVDSNDIKYGLGSTTEYISKVYSEISWRQKGVSYNMHNDICRIYLETTPIGSIIYTWSNFKMADTCYASFLMMLYMFIDMMFNHLTGLGSTTYWILVYLMIYYCNSKAGQSREAEENI